MHSSHKKFFRQLGIDEETFGTFMDLFAPTDKPYHYSEYDPGALIYNVPVIINTWPRSSHELTVRKILRHLAHDGLAIATNRFLTDDRQYGLNAMVDLILLDLDAKSPTQKASLDHRTNKCVALFHPFPMLLIQTSDTEGRRLKIPIQPCPVRHLNGDVNRTIENYLRAAGFDVPYEVDVLPKIHYVVRLPLGPGSNILDPWSLDILEDDTGAALDLIHEWYQSITPPTIDEIFVHLETQVGKPAQAPPKTARAGRRRRTPGNIDYAECRQWEADGLPGPDTRYEITLKMIRFFDLTLSPTTQDSLGDITWDWLRFGHNGYSDLVNNDQRVAEQWVRSAVSSYWSNIRPNIATNTIYGALMDQDIPAILDLVAQRPQIYSDCQTAWNDSQFLFGFLGFVKGQVSLQEKGDLGAMVHEVDVPREAWSRFPATNKNAETAHYYRNRQAMLRELGMLKTVGVAVGDRQSKSFRVAFTFSGDGVEIDVDDLEGHLRTIVPEAEQATFFAKKASKKFKPSRIKQNRSRRFASKGKR